MNSNQKSFKYCFFFLMLALGLPVMGFAAPQQCRQRVPRQQPRASINPADYNQYNRAEKAADVLEDLTMTPVKGIPRSLLNSAYGIAVFPNVFKAAFVVGGRWGKGLMAVRQRDGSWSDPIYVDIAGGSFGFQIGAQATDLVLVFQNRRGVESLLNSKLKLGVDATVAGGPVGRHVSASTDLKLNAQILSYSRSKGVFAGVSADGAVVSLDNSANEKVYGMSGKEVLNQPRISCPVTRPFLAALQRYTPAASTKATYKH